MYLWESVGRVETWAFQSVGTLGDVWVMAGASVSLGLVHWSWAAVMFISDTDCNGHEGT